MLCLPSRNMLTRMLAVVATHNALRHAENLFPAHLFPTHSESPMPLPALHELLKKNSDIPKALLNLLESDKVTPVKGFRINGLMNDRPHNIMPVN